MYKSGILFILIILFTASLYPGNNKQWPKTVDEATNILIEVVDKDNQLYIRSMSKFELSIFHWGLGLYIRNEFGLWADNKELLKSCDKSVHPDIASSYIIEAFWEKLRNMEPDGVVSKIDFYNGILIDICLDNHNFNGHSFKEIVKKINRKIMDYYKNNYPNEIPSALEIIIDTSINPFEIEKRDLDFTIPHSNITTLLSPDQTCWPSIKDLIFFLNVKYYYSGNKLIFFR